MVMHLWDNAARLNIMVCCCFFPDPYHLLGRQDSVKLAKGIGAEIPQKVMLG